jgi:general secretion pathway protein G
MKTPQRRRNKGFTILEILVVLSVVAILIGIAVPRLKGMQDNANRTKAKSELKMLQTAVESYYINTSPHAFPASSTTIAATSLTTATPAIISTAPYDPFAGTTTEYNYLLSTNSKYYVIWSIGIDATNATTAVSTTGVVTTGGDDICITNGSGC